MKKIIPVLLILVLSGFGYWKYYSWKHPESQVIAPSQVTNVTPSADGTATMHVPTATTNITGANISLDPVINGSYKGVIEVGASGFNAFVVNIDKEKNWEMVSKEFGESLAWEGFANTSDIYSQMKKYINKNKI